jgi:uncharacterized protein (TIGR02246 family)
LLASTAVALALGCAPAPPPDNSEEARAGIAAVNQRFMEAVEKKDAAGLAALYTEDGRVLPQGGPPVEGRAAIEQFFGGLLAAMGPVKIESVEVEGHGDTAYEQEALTFLDAAGAKVGEGKAVVIWKKVGEEWRLHRDIFNDNLPPAPPSEGAAPAGDDAAAPPTSP